MTKITKLTFVHFLSINKIMNQLNRFKVLLNSDNVNINELAEYAGDLKKLHSLSDYLLI